MTTDSDNGSTGAGPRILVVDDEPAIVDAVATTLRYNDYSVAEASSGREALAMALEVMPDLLVLDRVLPDFDGTEIVRRLRERGFTPAVLYLTAKDTVEEKVEALQAGGDDYVTKPFSLAEIVARVQAILRRTSAGIESGDVLTYADITLDETRREVRRNDILVPLTATEYALLRYFLLNPKQVLSREQILEAVWHLKFGGSTSVVETYVSYLRKKLDAAGPPLIKTVRQFGYMLEAES